MFKQVCIKFIPLCRWTHFSVSFSTSRKINLKLYTLDKKDTIKQFRYTILFRPVSIRYVIFREHTYICSHMYHITYHVPSSPRWCTYRQGGVLHRHGGVLHRHGGVFHRHGGVLHRLGGVLHRLGGVLHCHGGVLHRLGGVLHRLGGVLHRLGGVSGRALTCGACSDARLCMGSDSRSKYKSLKATVSITERYSHTPVVCVVV